MPNSVVGHVAVAIQKVTFCNLRAKGHQTVPRATISLPGTHCLPGDPVGDIFCGHRISVPSLDCRPVQLAVGGVDTTTLGRLDKSFRRPEALSVLLGQSSQRLDQVLDTL